MKYIASFSGGKDSTCMVLLLIEKKFPLDEVVFFDTGMEFEATYSVVDKIEILCDKNGIDFVPLYPPCSFRCEFSEKLKNDRVFKNPHKGASWCGGRCRWMTYHKKDVCDKYCGESIVYVGIAADEQRRYESLAPNKKAPLYELGITEKQALQYCYDHGYNWNEHGVELYDILDRVSCWCCANKNLKELKNIYFYLPEYWKKLEEMQAMTNRPFKNYHNKKFGWYGNIFTLGKLFKEGKL